jgi:hypothetical protein
VSDLYQQPFFFFSLGAAFLPWFWRLGIVKNYLQAGRQLLRITAIFSLYIRER